MRSCLRWLLLLLSGLSACAGGRLATDGPFGDGEGAGAQAGVGADGSTHSTSASGGVNAAGGKTATLGSSVAQGGASASTVCGGAPWIALSGVPNARSLGGVALSGRATVACDRLYRGSYLSGLTLQGCSDFATLGIRTVIDLRSLGEQGTAPAACVSEQATVISAPMPVPYSVSPTDYIADLYAAEAIVPAIEAMSKATAYPVYFHCLHGRDRSGVYSAVVLLALGASREEVLREYLLSEAAGYSVYPASLVAVLDEIDRLGGIDAYFKTLGIDAALITAMRQLLIVDS